MVSLKSFLVLVLLCAHGFAASAQLLEFDRMLVYEQSDYNGSVVRYQLLLNSRSGLFGFDRKLASLSLPGVGDGFTFATGSPDGTYRIYTATAYDGKTVQHYRVGQRAYAPGFAALCRQHFARRYRPTGKTERCFGLETSEYEASLGRRDREYLTVARVPFHLYPAYLFNEMPIEAKLPDAHSLNFVGRLGPNDLLIESRKVYYSEQVAGKPAVSTLRLVYVGPVRYTFDASGYR